MTMKIKRSTIEDRLASAIDRAVALAKAEIAAAFQKLRDETNTRWDAIEAELKPTPAFKAPVEVPKHLKVDNWSDEAAAAGIALTGAFLIKM
jgi:hypothetical protein